MKETKKTVTHKPKAEKRHKFFSGDAAKYPNQLATLHVADIQAEKVQKQALMEELKKKNDESDAVLSQISTLEKQIDVIDIFLKKRSKEILAVLPHEKENIRIS